MIEEPTKEEAITALSVGQKLRNAREAAGKDLAEIAQITRISIRQLKAIEDGEYAILPGRTYIIGFVRSYAQAVGENVESLLGQLSDEMESNAEYRRHDQSLYEAVDPTKLPPKMLVWGAIGMLVVLVAAYFIWRSAAGPDATAAIDASAGITSQQTEQAAGMPPETAAVEAAPDVAKTVVLTAKDDVWIRVYDGQGKRMFEQTLIKGDSYTVPADAQGPKILTGKPDALVFTINGKEVALQGVTDKTIVDFPIDAESLLKQPASKPADPTPPLAAGNP